MIVKFVRHGETDLNSPVRRMQGISNYDINEISVLSCILEGMPEDNNFENRGIKNGDIKEFII